MENEDNICMLQMFILFFLKMHDEVSFLKYMMELKMNLKLQMEKGRDWSLPLQGGKIRVCPFEKNEIKKEKWKIDTKEDFENGR